MVATGAAEAEVAEAAEVGEAPEVVDCEADGEVVVVVAQGAPVRVNGERRAETPVRLPAMPAVLR